jgi:benzoyl-CoA reductase/2-hydroxyglutaryl-CoA dehydratase subunit BcrC/BadD/HgdB
MVDAVHLGTAKYITSSTLLCVCTYAKYSMKCSFQNKLKIFLLTFFLLVEDYCNITLVWRPTLPCM